MIFSGELCDMVLAGTKTQTRRPVKHTYATASLLGEDVPCQYVVGKTYAVQRKRGTHGLGPRIHVLSVRDEDVAGIDPADALAEGFANREEFLSRWRDMYGDRFARCWRIEFEVVEP